MSHTRLVCIRAIPFHKLGCLGFKVGASALRIGCRLRLELDMKLISGV